LATRASGYEAAAFAVDWTSRFTPRTVLAQDATAKAQTRIVAMVARRDIFMDDVSLKQ
jgi:hypothetical protein